MFCGLPTSVAALPMFEAIATPSKCGAGLQRVLSQINSTTGVNSRQTISLIATAEAAPLTRIVAASNCRRDLTALVTILPNKSKKPASFRFATTTIIENNMMMVRKSTACPASSKDNTPAPIIATEPIIAAPARSTLNSGLFPSVKMTSTADIMMPAQIICVVKPIISRLIYTDIFAVEDFFHVLHRAHFAAHRASVFVFRFGRIAIALRFFRVNR